MKYLCLSFLILSFNAEARSLFCKGPNVNGGSQYADNVNTVEQDLRNGARAIATKRFDQQSSFVYELAIVASGRKLVSTITSVPVRLGEGNQAGVVLNLTAQVHGDLFTCEFRN